MDFLHLTQLVERAQQRSVIARRAADAHGLRGDPVNFHGARRHTAVVREALGHAAEDREVAVRFIIPRTEFADTILHDIEGRDLHRHRLPFRAERPTAVFLPSKKAQRQDGRAADRETRRRQALRIIPGHDHRPTPRVRRQELKVRAFRRQPPRRDVLGHLIGNRLLRHRAAGDGQPFGLGPLGEFFRELTAHRLVAAERKLRELGPQIDRHLLERDAEFAGDRVTVDHVLTNLGLDRRFARAQGRDPAARRNQQCRALGFDGDGDAALASGSNHVGQRGETERETNDLQSGGFQRGGQLLELLFAHRQLRNVSRAGGAVERPRNLQLRRIAREALLGLDLEKTVRIRGRELRHHRVLAHDPAGRERDHTMAFANAGGIEVIPDFAAHELRLRMQEIQGEGGRRGLDDLVGALGAGDMARPQVAVGKGESDDRGQPFFSFPFRDHDGLFVPLRVCRTCEPSAQP